MGTRRLYLSLPYGKTQGKFFFGAPPSQKIAPDHRLGHDAWDQSKAWQGNGREARKASDPSFGIARSLL
jgi:hypothetical protein